MRLGLLKNYARMELVFKETVFVSDSRRGCQFNLFRSFGLGTIVILDRQNVFTLGLNRHLTEIRNRSQQSRYLKEVGVAQTFEFEPIRKTSIRNKVAREELKNAREERFVDLVARKAAFPETPCVSCPSDSCTRLSASANNACLRGWWRSSFQDAS